MKLATLLKKVEEINCKQRIGRIEFLLDSSNLQTLYFPIPAYCRKTFPLEQSRREEEIRKQIEAQRLLSWEEYLIASNITWY
jgi:hypothetical protein